MATACCSLKRPIRGNDRPMSMTCDPELLTEAVGSLKSMLVSRGATISVSGVDGSGKTLLTTHLVKILRDANIAVLRLHSYQWYKNITTTPVRILVNKYFGRKILLLDRGIYDNIAVFSSTRGAWELITDMAVGLAIKLYPTFDFRFYLSTSLVEGLRRRPEMDASQLSHLQQVYAPIVHRAGYLGLESNERLLDRVLEHLAHG